MRSLHRVQGALLKDECECVTVCGCVVLCLSADSYVSLLCRRLSISVLFFYGRWYLPIPYRVPITLVAGKSISTTPTDQPTKEQINQVNDSSPHTAAITTFLLLMPRGPPINACLLRYDGAPDDEGVWRRMLSPVCVVLGCVVSCTRRCWQLWSVCLWTIERKRDLSGSRNVLSFSNREGFNYSTAILHAHMRSRHKVAHSQPQLQIHKISRIEHSDSA